MTPTESQSGTVVLTAQQKATIDRLDHKLVAPCCYSQVLADHLSQESADMRKEVADLVVAGKSEREITEYYKAKYGKIILATPDGPWGNFALATPPAVGVTSVLLLLIFMKRTFRKQLIAHSLSASAGIGPKDSSLIARIRAETTDMY
jgi:cytochrome c-type biogenesis protein CcmH/NrfF